MRILGWSVESGTRVSRCWPPSASDSVALIGEQRDSMLRWPSGGGRPTSRYSLRRGFGCLCGYYRSLCWPTVPASCQGLDLAVDWVGCKLSAPEPSEAV